jgi:arylsulfatase A-like enzyme
MQKSPNIILIFSDQHRTCDLVCYGNKQIKTENLDKLAKDSVLFTNAVLNCPVCTPARESLLTGY